MHTARLGLAVTCLALALAACGGPQRPAGPGQATASSTCPPNGTEENLGKVFAMGADYVGCSVRAQGTFSGLAQTFCTMTARMQGEDNLVEFQVTTAGEPVPKGVLISKAASGPVFNLKSGDPIVLTGGTVVSGAGMHCFKATAVQAAQPVAAH
jgi:hypothetical protein